MDGKQTKEGGSSGERNTITHSVTRFLMKQTTFLNTSYFRSHRQINCLVCFTADPPVSPELWGLFGVLLDAKSTPRLVTSHPFALILLESSQWSYWKGCWLQQVMWHIKKVSVNVFWLPDDACKNSQHIIKYYYSAPSQMSGWEMHCSEQSWPQAAIQQGTISRIHWISFGKSFLKASLN